MPHSKLASEDGTGAAADLPSWPLIWSRFRRHPLALAGMALLGVLMLMNIGAVVLDPLIRRSLGQSIWANPIYREPPVLVIGFSSGLLAMLLGTALGSVGPCWRGLGDRVLLWLLNGLLAWPLLPWLIALTAIVLVVPGSRGHPGLIIGFSSAVLGFLFTPGIARVARGSYRRFEAHVLSEAARAGRSGVRMIFWQMLPKVLGPILVSTAFILAGCILLEATLDFLGFGASFQGGGMPSWGTVTALGQDAPLPERWVWLLVFPGLMLLLTVLAINFIGAGLRAALGTHATGKSP